MKQILLTALVLATAQLGLSQNQDSQIGDNFSLENTLELFKSSASLEAFEKN